MSDALKTAPVEVSDLEWESWRAFMVMHNVLERRLGDRLQDQSGISNPDYIVLLALWRAADHRLRANELGRRIAWEKSRLSHQISRLEQRELVTREECDDDLRGKWIVITHAGRRAVLSAMRDHNRAIREYFFDVVTPDELAVFKSVSDRVSAATCAEVDEDQLG